MAVYIFQTGRGRKMRGGAGQQLESITNSRAEREARRAQREQDELERAAERELQNEIPVRMADQIAQMRRQEQQMDAQWAAQDKLLRSQQGLLRGIKSAIEQDLATRGIYVAPAGAQAGPANPVPVVVPPPPQQAPATPPPAPAAPAPVLVPPPQRGQWTQSPNVSTPAVPVSRPGRQRRPPQRLTYNQKGTPGSGYKKMRGGAMVPTRLKNQSILKTFQSQKIIY